MATSYDQRLDGPTPVGAILLLLSSFAYFVGVLSITVRRSHDFGLGAGWAVAIFALLNVVSLAAPIIGVAGLLWLLIPGAKQANRFGLRPEGWWTAPQDARGGAGQRRSGANAGDSLHHLIGLMARFAKTDGVVRREELRVIHLFFVEGLGLSGADLDAAERLFGQLKNEQTTVTFHARRFSQLEGRNLPLFISLFDVLVQIAAADGQISEAELKGLKSVADVFGISREIDFEALRKMGREGPRGSGSRSEGEPGAERRQTESPDEVLGITADASPEQIKAAYREKCKQYHPDLVANLGPKLQRLAEDELKRINAAYETLKAQGRV